MDMEKIITSKVRQNLDEQTARASGGQSFSTSLNQLFVLINVTSHKTCPNHAWSTM